MARSDLGAMGLRMPLALFPRDHCAEEVHELRIELSARPAPYFRKCQLLLTRRRGGMLLAHRVEGVADEDDPGPDRDVLAGQAVRVALPVPALVGGANQTGHRGERRGRAQNPLTDQRVLSDQLPLDLVERLRLAQDFVGNRDLAEVVELGRAPEHVDLLRIHAQLAAHRDGDAGHVLLVIRWLELAVAQDADQQVMGPGFEAAGANALLLVHAAVGDPQRLAGYQGLVGKRHGARRGADAKSLTLFCQSGSPGFDDGPHAPAAQLREDAEFVAAQAVGAAAGLHSGRQVRAQPAKQAVAGGVAEAVVVELEPVQIVESENVATPWASPRAQG